MLLSLTVENIEIKLEVKPLAHYEPSSSERWGSRGLQKEIDQGVCQHVSLMITSTRENEEQIHYLPHLILPVEQEALIEELEVFLDQEGALDHILNSWKSRDKAGLKPAWSKV